MNIWAMFGVVWAVVFGTIVGLMELKRWTRKRTAARAAREIEELTRLRFNKDAAGEGGYGAGADWLLK